MVISRLKSYTLWTTIQVFSIYTTDGIGIWQLAAMPFYSASYRASVYI